MKNTAAHLLATPRAAAPSTLTLTFKFPCVNLCAASAALGLPVYKVRELLDDGRLRAFDVSLRARTHREVRILVADLDAYQRNDRIGDGFIGALHLIFPVLATPAAPKSLRAATIYRRLVVSHTTILNLIARRELSLAGSKPRCGPTGSPQITEASLTAFLQRRFLQ